MYFFNLTLASQWIARTHGSMKYGSELLGHPIFPESIPLAHLLLRAPGFNLTVIYASQRLSITLIHITCRWFRLILSILSTRLFFRFCDKPISPDNGLLLSLIVFAHLGAAYWIYAGIVAIAKMFDLHFVSCC